MRTNLLKLATRHRDGSRQWTIPGIPIAIKAFPASASFWPDSASVSWPHFETNRGAPDWVRRGARLDWHRSIVKTELRKLMLAYCK